MATPRIGKPNRSASGEPAFTLVELIVSITVLSLLLVMVSQMTNAASKSVNASRNHLDADSQARMVFDRMASDFETMVRRPDVDYLFSKQNGSAGGGNDEMFFYTEGPVYSGPTTATTRSGVGLAGYRINSSFQLERLGKALTWDGAPSSATPGCMVYLTFGAAGTTTPTAASTIAGNWPTVIGSPTDSPPYCTGTDPDYHLLAESVYRMEFCFQVKDLTNPSAPASAYSNYPIAHFGAGAQNSSVAQTSAPSSAAGGDRWYDTTNNRAFVCTGETTTGAPIWKAQGLNDVLGIVVALGVLDTTSRKPLLAAGNGAIPTTVGARMVAAFADPQTTDLQSTPPKLMLESWQSALNNASFAANAGIFQTTATQVRIYQRSFSLGQN